MKLSVPSSVRGRGAPVMKNTSVFPVLSSENSCCACTQQRYYTSIYADVKRFLRIFESFLPKHRRGRNFALSSPSFPGPERFCIHSIQNRRKTRREIRKSARILKKLLTFHPRYGIVVVPVRVLFLCSKSLIRFREAKNTGGAVLCVQRSLLPVQSASSATTIRSKTRRTIPIVLR